MSGEFDYDVVVIGSGFGGCPALGIGYQRIRPLEPLKPLVPAHAPAALRLQ
jgi:hypothetical protein